MELKEPPSKKEVSPFTPVTAIQWKRSEVETKLLNSKRDNDYGCWDWVGASNLNKQGVIYIDNNLYSVVQLSAWLWPNPSMPTVVPQAFDPTMYGTNCGNKYCYNPDHLVYLGAQTLDHSQSHPQDQSKTQDQDSHKQKGQK